MKVQISGSPGRVALLRSRLFNTERRRMHPFDAASFSTEDGRWEIAGSMRELDDHSLLERVFHMWRRMGGLGIEASIDIDQSTATRGLLHTSPQFEDEPGARDVYRELAEGGTPGFSVHDYQLFTGVSLLAEHITNESRYYFGAKLGEELSEFMYELKHGDEDDIISEFGDVTWAVFGIMDNAFAGSCADKGMRPAFSEFIYRSLAVNGIDEVESVVYREPNRLVIIPTVQGISNADLADYVPVYYGPQSRTCYRKDTDKLGDCTEDVVLSRALTESNSYYETAMELVAIICDTPDENVMYTMEMLGYAAANLWLSLAYIVQSRYGTDAIKEAICGNIKKVCMRIESGGVSKTERVKP